MMLTQKAIRNHYGDSDAPRLMGLPRESFLAVDFIREKVLVDCESANYE